MSKMDVKIQNIIPLEQKFNNEKIQITLAITLANACLVPGPLEGVGMPGPRSLLGMGIPDRWVYQNGVGVYQRVGILVVGILRGYTRGVWVYQKMGIHIYPPSSPPRHGTCIQLAVGWYAFYCNAFLSLDLFNIYLLFLQVIGNTFIPLYYEITEQEENFKIKAISVNCFFFPVIRLI